MLPEEREAAVMLSASRKRIYKILCDLWINTPQQRPVETLFDWQLESLLNLLTPDDGPDLNQAFAPLRALQNTPIETLLPQVQAEYEHLMSGEADVPMPPFAIAYLPMDKDEAMEEMLEIRSTYERYGADHAQQPLEAEGHIGIEFDFMFRTCGLAQQALEVGRDDRAAILLDEQEYLLQEHMLSWVKLWHQAMQKADSLPFYRMLADFSYAYLLADGAGIEAVLDII